MSAIRGEKVTFRKKDIVALHDLPSAKAEDPLIVHCPPHRVARRRTIRAFVGVLSLLLVLVVGLVGVIESGMFDRSLTSRAQTALNDVVGPRYSAQIGSTGIRFTSQLQLALEARDVSMTDLQSGRHLSTTGSLRMVLDPLKLLKGNVAVSSISADDIALDTGLLPAGNPVKLTDLRVDSLPQALEETFAHLDILHNFVSKSNTSAVELSGIDIKLADTANGPLSIRIDDLTFRRIGAGSLQLDGDIAINGKVARLSVEALTSGDHVTRLVAHMTDTDLAPFALKRNEQGEIRQGVQASADLTVSAARAIDGIQPVLTASADIKSGFLYMDGDQQELTSGKINLGYNFEKKSLEIERSNLQLAASSIPLNGAIIDLDQIDPSAGKGFGIDLLVSGGVAAPIGSGEQPLGFDIQATGQFLSESRELQFSKMAVASAAGSFYGSLHVKFADVSPEISFVGQSEKLQTTAVKQLWPFWMAPKARDWTLHNLFGGTVTNASLSVFIPFGMLDEAVTKGLHLDEKQIHIAFDVSDTRMNVTGDIPPIRDTSAHFDLSGPKLTVALQSGTSFFASGRSVAVGQGTFILPSTYEKPLMAEINLPITGSADSVGELLTYKPLQVLQRADLTPADLKGQVAAQVSARFGLIQSQNPPEPVWNATLDLTNVDINKQISGRTISRVNGKLTADPDKVFLDAKAQIDGIPADIEITQPVSKTANIQAQQVIIASLSDQQRNKIIPGLADMIDGDIKVELDKLDDNRQNVTVDLGQATVKLPWIGWSKGSGINANATFELSGAADNIQLKNFKLRGEGFGASGNLSINKGSLTSADFDQVKLSSLDDFAVSVKRSKSSFDVTVAGDSADLRPILARLKSDKDGGDDDGGSSASPTVTVHAKLDKVAGFNDERLANLNATYVASGSRVKTVNFTSVTSSGQAFVGQTVDDGAIRLTSGDAGSVARFADLYQHVQGGLLNLTIRPGSGKDWDGAIDLRRFTLVNEQRLKSIVSTPVGQNQQSLNSAVKRDIDTSAQRFQRGFARVYSRDGIVAVENGVVRGDQVGAVFQGVIRDARGNMDMTGTFMPAYGLNRLFAELPVIGFILGNGSDRGLIGITFRLTGKFDKPNLQINPLSIIAPGVFRNIFEFQ
ncbi:YhdP family protein [Oryzifoliimicrobium ureilyticus]|uniref:YhdP family protein n=1 Tax=Oryzifoliimicrobium ureilyticus TaxID=3113724 RepID=UPI003076116F